MPKVLLALAIDQQLHTRNLQVLSQAAQLKVHRYKQQADAELLRLQTDANNKSQAVLNYLNQVGTAGRLDTTKVLFDFESMVFIDNTPAAPVVPASAPAQLQPAQQAEPLIKVPVPAGDNNLEVESLKAAEVVIPAAVAPPETAS